jgi:predicted SnoaL-like aldol condensation-catalyzing enzyme
LVPDQIQHSAHIAPGRERLFNLINSLPLKYEPGTIVAEADLVIVHGRFSDFGAPVNWIAADIVRILNGILVEHWDGWAARSRAISVPFFQLPGVMGTKTMTMEEALERVQ